MSQMNKGKQKQVAMTTPDSPLQIVIEAELETMNIDHCQQREELDESYRQRREQLEQRHSEEIQELEKQQKEEKLELRELHRQMIEDNRTPFQVVTPPPSSPLPVPTLPVPTLPQAGPSVLRGQAISQKRPWEYIDLTGIDDSDEEVGPSGSKQGLDRKKKRQRAF
ncbi:hypothetical protein VKT23_008181 [Stygiomarasmius scandens]|uniref:Uncharacterized protein n=1 Tax=Marasmiellus scandens TaxID=2682957 RepID=A0ABR1JMV3_9AGAR